MTFSIAARDPETGAYGLAITTSSLCVGARCTFARPRIGAILTQHRTDPRLGAIGLDLLTDGRSAEETLAILTEGRDDAAWRQLAVVDNVGNCAAYHGREIYSWHGHATAEGAIAIGNILRAQSVPDAMLSAFLDDRAPPLHERLAAALTAGLAAGGELKPVRSAAILVVGTDPFPWIDARVDRSDDPVTEVAEIARAYAEIAPGFRDRVLRPETIPDDPELVSLHRALVAGAAD